MKITIEPTNRIVYDEGNVEYRVWEGASARGAKVQCLIRRIAVINDGDLSEFEDDLKETRAPSTLQAFPTRMIL